MTCLCVCPSGWLASEQAGREAGIEAASGGDRPVGWSGTPKPAPLDSERHGTARHRGGRARRTCTTTDQGGSIRWPTDAATRELGRLSLAASLGRSLGREGVSDVPFRAPSAGNVRPIRSDPIRPSCSARSTMAMQAPLPFVRACTAAPLHVRPTPPFHLFKSLLHYYSLSRPRSLARFDWRRTSRARAFLPFRYHDTTRHSAPCIVTVTVTVPHRLFQP